MTSFQDKIPWKDVFLPWDITERHPFKIWYHGKLSFRDIISRKDAFSWYILEWRVSLIWYPRKTPFLKVLSRKDIFLWYPNSERHISLIFYLWKKSFQGILSWKDAIHNNTIWETRQKYQCILSFHNNRSRKRDNVDGHFKLPYGALVSWDVINSNLYAFSHFLGERNSFFLNRNWRGTFSAPLSERKFILN